MQVYNTQSRKKEELIPLDPPNIRMYVCGPTTYNFIHLGNARPLVFFDTVRRYLEYRGYKVKYVQNFTDVDDKIINRALKEGEEPLKLASRYIEEYFKDADALGVRRADVHPRVSEHIDDIIKAITGLIAKGYAYVVDGDVYYRVEAFPGYGKLSGRTQEEMMAGARVEIDERKENPADFALWKKAKPGEPYWESPWGKGRPGWHIECSVMAVKYLGETLDIHGGGNDLIFPHHENELAQAEALTGKPFVRYWMHNGFITVNNEKMSKSLGNFFLLRDILAKFPPDVVRFYLLSVHYRSPLDFDDGKLTEAGKALGRLKNTRLLACEFIEGGRELEKGLAQDAFIEEVKREKAEFIAAMDDDFNTAQALGHLFNISRLLNSYMAEADKHDELARARVREALHIFEELGNILGIFMEYKEEKEDLWLDLAGIMLDVRQMLREEKNFVLADQIRNCLYELGIVIEDTPEKSRIKAENAPPVEKVMEKVIFIRSELRKNKDYARADYIRDRLKEKNILIEDTREGARWRFAQI
ncbi:cysteinyl-tRNA synthetase [Thermosyntropha lipolytica DSM 11003]|uniref:Cysteine--tRNA ligase n=1 Tax=Thermosyntropha lipolytica DSM 11003 TaxID=1123382 RepID=A0A1M5NRB3_9FIRM|nr:cysteine--tRNA ligase [Thermosyntropha lipolytica]SHG92017.1 cysteinyl-tRNA synthetase [Thermosyntropha lipolytica DSM 11003]